jgi:hypothetical protein
VQRFLSQPFKVAEVFTGRPGIYVKLEETIRGFAEILDGKHDDLPEDAFYMVGTIDQAVAKGQELEGTGAEGGAAAVAAPATGGEEAPEETAKSAGEKPVTETTEKPAVAKTEKPAADKTEKPAVAKTEKPAADKTEKPAAEAPAELPVPQIVAKPAPKKAAAPARKVAPASGRAKKAKPDKRG